MKKILIFLCICLIQFASTALADSNGEVSDLVEITICAVEKALTEETTITESQKNEIQTLLNEGNYREAMYACRRANTPELLKRAYQIESVLLWKDSALTITANRGYKFPGAQVVGSSFWVRIRNQSGETQCFYGEQTGSNKPTLTEFRSFHLSNVASINELFRFDTERLFSVMNDGSIAEYYYDQGLKEWRASHVGISKAIDEDDFIVKLDGDYALTSEGTLISGDREWSNEWKGIVDFVHIDDFLEDYLIGLKYDGTIVCTLASLDEDDTDKLAYMQENFFSPVWSDIIDIDRHGELVIGYRKDGSVVASCTMRDNKWDSCEVPEMKNITDAKGVFLGRDMERGDWRFVGLREDGVLISDIENFPTIENVMAFDICYDSGRDRPRTVRDGAGGMTLFCLMQDGSFARFGIQNVDPSIKKELAPIMTDETVELINSYFK